MLATNAGLLTPILGDPSPWNPQRLYINGEAGVWYDPGDLTAEKVAWALANPGFTAAQFLAAFPTHALYQDAAGTTPVTALGQPVGLALDKSRGALASIGTTVLTNGDFASGTGWTAGTGWSIAAGVATKTAGTASVLSQAVTLTIPGTYRLVYTMTRSAGTLTPRITGGTTVSATARSASGTYTEYVTTVTGNTTFEFSADASFAGTVDDVALQLVPGVHAIQATSASRPALDARVNLLTHSEQFDNAAWTKLGASVTANSAVAPDGTSTADALVEDTSTGTHQVRQDFTTAAVPYAFSVYAKASGRSWLLLYNTTAGYGRAFNLTTGQLGTASIGTSTGTVENVGNGWYRCTLTGTPTAASNAFRIYANTADDMNASYAGTGISSVLLWGADLRLATDAAYPYQRVVTATDYADVGVPRSFLHDGFDDSTATASNLDLSGTDKVTVWAGVYKNSDANGAILAELSADSNVNNGSFYLTAPSDTAAAGNFGLQIGGTARVLIKSGTVLAPVLRVYTGTSDIATPSAALRLNGVQAASTTASLGTGNFGNYVFFIGRRNNASNPFNGKIYTIIIRGGVTDAATLALTERYVGSRMGIVL
jgi:hypothetical protein